MSQQLTSTTEDRTPATCFEYQRAETWQDAVELLSLWEGEAKILAGGQSLVPMLNLRLAFPAALIDVNPVPTAEPYVEDGHLVLPALTRHAVLARSELVRRHAPLLSHAVQFVGNVRVRNRGTLGGSLSHADPTAELAAVVMAMNGTITVLGGNGTRTIPAADFFVTYLTTALAEDEVVTEVRLPCAGGSSWGFHEVVRRYSDFATVSVSVVAAEDLTGLRVVLGGVADRPVLVADALLDPVLQAPADAEAVRAAATGIAASVDPDSDLHGSADHKRHLVAVHTRRLLEQVLADAGRDA